MTRAIAILLALALPFGAAPSMAKRAPRSPIEGVWKTDCLPIGKNGRHGFVTRLEVSGKTLTATSQIYAHSNCDLPTVSTVYRGAIVATAAAPDGAVYFDYVVRAITMTPDHPEVVAIYNKDDASGCGMGGGWVLGVARGVEGRFCAPFIYPVAGTRLYERAWVAGDDLRIGSFPTVWTNTAPGKRPATPGLLVFHRYSGRDK